MEEDNVDAQPVHALIHTNAHIYMQSLSLEEACGVHRGGLGSPGLVRPSWETYNSCVNEQVTVSSFPCWLGRERRVLHMLGKVGNC